MGEIKIDIPKDMEAAFEEAFRGEDKATAVLRLIEVEIARRQDADERALRLRQEPRGLVERLRQIRARSRPVTDDEIRQAREELRK
jgi:hypothetical protein